MVTRAKPDSSYASTRLTRRNFHGQSLHGQRLREKFEEKPCDDDAAMKSEEQGPEAQLQLQTDDELHEDIFAEPLSSEDEDASEAVADGSDDEKETRSTGPTLEEKLAGDEMEAATDTQQPKRRRSGRRPNNPAQQVPSKRAPSQSSDDGNDDAIFSWSSQTSVKRRNTTYQRKSFPSSANAPSSSVPSSLPAEAPSPKFQQPRSIPPSSLQEDQDGGFKMPMNVDLASPPSRTHSGVRTMAGTSPVPGFKQPLPLPNDMISSSSLTISTTKDPQVFDLDDLDTSSLSTPLSSISSPGAILESLDLPEEAKKFLPTDIVPKTSKSDGPRCPMCKEEVDGDLLMDFLAQPKQRIRDQQRFCESHKKISAEKEWHEKGYPTIDWETFDERIRRHFAGLEKLLVPDSSSYFRNILDSTLKSGKAKNFRLSITGNGLETISCGYYGSRGAGIMLNAVTTHFSRRIRRLAATDNIVKLAGVAGYAQSVLVPELTVRLVKEDMGVTDESARQILRDSIELGEKLNFALNDVVPSDGADDGAYEFNA